MAQTVKRLPTLRETQIQSLGWEDLEKEMETHSSVQWQPTPVFLPGESQGWGSLVGYRLWGRTELVMTEAT